MYIRFDTDKFKDAVVRQVKRTGSDIGRNAEGITILSLAGIGLSSLLSRLPFVVAVPAAVNPATVIPVVSVGVIGVLVKIASKRRK